MAGFFKKAWGCHKLLELNLIPLSTHLIIQILKQSKKHLAAIAILAEMADEGYATNPAKWEHHRDKAECHIYGWHFTKESAEKAVAAMQNKDGSSGQYWTLKDVEEVSKAMSIDWSQKRYNIYDLYYVLNMERSDYYKADEAPQYYVERALDFLNDKDAPEGKAKRYYVAMHCMD